MRTWLHRISQYAAASYPLLDRGFLTIAFGDFSEPKFITNLTSRSEEESWRYLEDEFEQIWKIHPKSRYSLWYFVREMKAGDRVLVPQAGIFSIYEITEDIPLCIRDVDIAGLREWDIEAGRVISLAPSGLLRLAEEEEELHLGFARRVREIRTNIPRALFADAALTSRMKIRCTTSDISDLNENIERSLSFHSSGTPIDLHATLLEKNTDATLEAIKSDLNDKKLEILVGWYFKKVGANKVDLPSKNESGKEGDGDIVATFDALRTIIYVQVKAHRHATDVWAAEQITAYRNQKERLAAEGGVMDDGYARIAWVVSTADKFTNECIALAKENRVLLLNGKDFVKLLLNAGIAGLSGALNRPISE